MWSAPVPSFEGSLSASHTLPGYRSRAEGGLADGGASGPEQGPATVAAAILVILCNLTSCQSNLRAFEGEIPDPCVGYTQTPRAGPLQSYSQCLQHYPLVPVLITIQK